jgi:hypothetical protein
MMRRRGFIGSLVASGCAAVFGKKAVAKERAAERPVAATAIAWHERYSKRTVEHARAMFDPSALWRLTNFKNLGENGVALPKEFSALIVADLMGRADVVRYTGKTPTVVVSSVVPPSVNPLVSDAGTWVKVSLLGISGCTLAVKNRGIYIKLPRSIVSNSGVDLVAYVVEQISVAFLYGYRLTR